MNNKLKKNKLLYIVIVNFDEMMNRCPICVWPLRSYKNNVGYGKDLDKRWGWRQQKGKPRSYIPHTQTQTHTQASQIATTANDPPKNKYPTATYIPNK